MWKLENKWLEWFGLGLSQSLKIENGNCYCIVIYHWLRKPPTNSKHVINDTGMLKDDD